MTTKTICSSAPNVLADILAFTMQNMHGGGEAVQHSTIKSERIRSVTIHPTKELQILASLQIVENPDETETHPALAAYHTNSNSHANGSEVDRRVVGSASAVCRPDDLSRLLYGQVGEQGDMSGMRNAFARIAVSCGAAADPALTLKGVAIADVFSFLLRKIKEDLLEFPEYGLTSSVEIQTSVRRMLNNTLSLTVSLVARHGNRFLRYMIKDQTGVFNGDHFLDQDVALENHAQQVALSTIAYLVRNDFSYLRNCKGGKMSIREHVIANLSKEKEHGMHPDVISVLSSNVMNALAHSAAALRRNALGATTDGEFFDENARIGLKAFFFGEGGHVANNDMEWILDNCEDFMKASVFAGWLILQAGYRANYRQRASDTREAIAKDLQSI